MYHYYLYGIDIASEVKLYHLDQRQGEKEDVRISYGMAGEEIEEKMKQGINSAMSSTRVWFVNDIGIFVVQNGNEITIDVGAGATEDDVASFVLGWCMAFLFQQRGNVAIHCSALEMAERAVLIAGNSGAGKSTLAMGLQQRGYSYLVDDIAMVDLENDMYIQPAFPMQKVCRNLAEKMDAEAVYYVNEKKDKFAYRNMENFCSVPRKLSTIFLLEKYDGEEVKMESLSGVKKWNSIMKHLFLRDAYVALGIPREEISRCLEIAGKTEVYVIYRPSAKDTVSEICDRIVDIVEGQVEV